MRRPYTRGPIPRPELQRKHKINDEISGPELRVIDSTGEALGVLTRRDALKLATDRELDLVEIAPQAKPPVCKIIDYGKFVYEATKKEKEHKKAQIQQQLKELRFKAGTDTHDFDFKTRHAREFLEEGHKVKATVLFRGREIVHQEIGRDLLQRFIDALADVSKVDQDMRTEGRILSVTLAPESVKKPKTKKSDSTDGKPVDDKKVDNKKEKSKSGETDA